MVSSHETTFQYKRQSAVMGILSKISLILYPMILNCTLIICSETYVKRRFTERTGEGTFQYKRQNRDMMGICQN